MVFHLQHSPVRRSNLKYTWSSTIRGMGMATWQTKAPPSLVRTFSSLKLLEISRPIVTENRLQLRFPVWGTDNDLASKRWCDLGWHHQDENTAVLFDTAKWLCQKGYNWAPALISCLSPVAKQAIALIPSWPTSTEWLYTSEQQSQDQELQCLESQITMLDYMLSTYDHKNCHNPCCQLQMITTFTFRSCVFTCPW